MTPDIQIIVGLSFFGILIVGFLIEEYCRAINNGR